MRFSECNTADNIRHTPLLHHALGNVGNLLDIIGGTSGDKVLSVDELLGKTSSKSNSELRLKVLLGVHSRLKTLLLGGEEGKSSCTIGAGDDGNLLHLIVVGDESTTEGVSSLVVGNKLILTLGKHGGTSLLLESHHDTVNGTVNLLPSNSGFSNTCRRNGSLIHQVLKLSTRETGSTTSNGLKIYIRFKGLSTGMDTQDTSTSLEVRKVHSDLTIETSRTQQGSIQNIHTVSGSNGNDTRVSIETIHLYQNLVNCLFTLVVTTGESGTTLTSNSINLINEDDAGGILLGLGEDITDTGGTHSNEHLNELGTRD